MSLLHSESPPYLLQFIDAGAAALVAAGAGDGAIEERHQRHLRVLVGDHVVDWGISLGFEIRSWKTLPVRDERTGRLVVGRTASGRRRVHRRRRGRRPAQQVAVGRRRRRRGAAAAAVGQRCQTHQFFRRRRCQTYTEIRRQTKTTYLTIVAFTRNINGNH